VPHDEHRNLGPVLTRIPDLGRNEIIRRKALDFSGPQRSPPLPFLQEIVETILVKERRVCEAREGGEEPRLLSFTPNGGLSDEIWSEPSDAFTVLEIVEVDLIFDLLPSVSLPASLSDRTKPAHIFLVHYDEMVTNQHPDLEFRVLLLGDQILLCEFFVHDIDRDDLLSWCALVGQDVEECTIVSKASRVKEKGVRIHNGRGTPGERNQHVVTGVELVDDLGPFQFLTDLVPLEICDPHEVFLRKRDEVE